MRTEWKQRLTDGLMYQWQCCGFCIDPVAKRRLSVHLQVDLLSDPHLCQQAVDSDRKNETVDTSSRNELPLKRAWTQPYRYGEELGSSSEPHLFQIKRMTKTQCPP